MTVRVAFVFTAVLFVATEVDGSERDSGAGLLITTSLCGSIGFCGVWFDRAVSAGVVTVLSCATTSARRPAGSLASCDASSGVIRDSKTVSRAAISLVSRLVDVGSACCVVGSDVANGSVVAKGSVVAEGSDLATGFDSTGGSDTALGGGFE